MGFGQDIFEVLEINAFVDNEALVVMEETGVTGVEGFVAVDLAGGDGAEWRLVGGEDPGFDRGSVGAHDEVGFFDKEGVLEVGGGVAFGEIELAKVVLGSFEFRTFGNGEAMVAEEAVELADDDGGGVEAAGGSGSNGNR